MNDEKFQTACAECKRLLQECGAHYVLLAGYEDGSGIRAICRSVDAREAELTTLLVTLVNYVPAIRGFFRPSFVEICKHAPESAGGDGDMKAAARNMAAADVAKTQRGAEGMDILDEVLNGPIHEGTD